MQTGIQQTSVVYRDNKAPYIKEIIHKQKQKSILNHLL